MHLMICPNLYVCTSVCTSVIALIILLILGQKKLRNLPNYLLSAIILVVGAHYVLMMFLEVKESYAPCLTGMKNLFELFALPITYAFVNSHFGINHLIKKSSNLGYVFIVVLVAYLILLWSGSAQDWLAFEYTTDFIVASELIWISIQSLKLLKYHEKKQGKGWIRFFTYALFLHGILILAHLVIVWQLPKYDDSSQVMIDYIYYVFLGYMLIYVTIRYPQILHRGKFSKNRENHIIKLDDPEAINHRLEKHMMVHKPYLDPDITLVELAEAIGISTRQLSHFLNGHKKISFYQYINSFRGVEFLELAKDESNRNKKIIALAYEAGFKSKSTFNDFFKKMYGIPPSKYLKEWQENQ